MRKVIFLLIYALSLINLKAQEYVGLSMGPSYAYDIYYSLANGITATPERTNWELAFSTNPYDNNIRINSGNVVALYEVSNNINEWENITELNSNAIRLRNSNTDWSLGAFVVNSADGLNYGWGDYNTESNIIEGSRIYIITYGTVTKKMIINSLDQGVYSFTIANLDGSSEENISVDTTPYINKKFIYFSLLSNEIVDREPNADQWDLLFTKYEEDLNNDIANPLDYEQPYFVTGVLSNGNLLAQHEGSISDDYNIMNLDTTRNINAIGYDWKEYSGSFVMISDRSYYIADQNEEFELNQILENSTKEGLRFISDSDARSIDGSHAYAHLWDNGDTAKSGLDHVIDIRELAIDNFSEKNVPVGTPNSVLEDVFVPLYFFHRYQTEAAVKLIGGMDYNYSLVGDNQNQFYYLDKDTQIQALNSLMRTLTPSFLAIPKEKLKLFPPRAFGYPRTRESFKSNLGVAFDPFSVSETSADMTLSLIFRPKRLNRLILQHSVESSNLSLDELYDFILKRTILMKINNDSTQNDSYLNEVQHIVNVTLLKNIFAVINDSNTFSQVKKISNDYLTKISSELSSKKSNDYKLSEYSDYYIKMIMDFHQDPKEYEIIDSLKIPDGSPIGTDDCSHISQR